MSGVVVLYIAALFFELLRFHTRRVNAVPAVVCSAGGLAVHTFYLLNGHLTQSSSAKFFLISAWTLAAVCLLFLYFRPKIPAGIILLPLVLLFAGISLTQPIPSSALISYSSPLLIHLHLILLLSATICVCIAFFAALMYLLQDTHLRKKQLPAERPQLPTLEWSLFVCRWLLAVSFFLFLGGFLTGFALAVLQHRVPFDLFSIGTFGLLAVYGYWATVPKNDGRRIAFNAVVVFVLLLIILAASLL
ncbi:MAG: hypothetical protein LBN39_07280 [Planctomycetaceae bacterium]|jgi:ABC-type uncharacterized transport system permease subunit|nr:hypothetical protein [Planctomycetaceae bacterium]